MVTCYECLLTKKLKISERENDLIFFFFAAFILER